MNWNHYESFFCLHEVFCLHEDFTRAMSLNSIKTSAVYLASSGATFVTLE